MAQNWAKRATLCSKNSDPEPPGATEAPDTLEEAWTLRDQDPKTADRLLSTMDTSSLDEMLSARHQAVRAFLRFREGRFRKALELALDADPVLQTDVETSWRARNSLTLASLYTGVPNSTVIGYLGRAIADAARVSDRELLFGSYHDLAVQFTLGHDWVNAESAFDSAERYVDGDAGRACFLTLNRAHLQLRQDRPNEALELLLGFPQAGTEHTTVALFIWSLRALACSGLGLLAETEEALSNIRQLSEVLGRVSKYVAAAHARLFFLEGKHDEALNLLADFERDQPEIAQGVYDVVTQLRIDIAVDRGQFQTAFVELKRLTEYDLRVRQATQAPLIELRLQHESERWRRQADELETTNAELSASVRELRELHRQVLEASVRDPLTQLFNRRQLFVEAGLLMRLARRHGRPFSLAMVDVDHFKAVNDQHFHTTGDAVLRELADILTSEIRESDLVGRYGGDEFVVLLPEVDLDGALVLCERIRRAVEANRWQRIQRDLQVTVTIGIAQAIAGESATDLLHRADQQLFVAKKLGRNQVAT